MGPVRVCGLVVETPQWKLIKNTHTHTHLIRSTDQPQHLFLVSINPLLLAGQNVPKLFGVLVDVYKTDMADEAQPQHNGDCCNWVNLGPNQ